MLRITRHRVSVFVRFTVRRFLDEHCLQTAGALAFTSLFALVPLITVVLSILAAFPVFAQWRDKISGFIFANFLPASGDVVQTYFTQFADNASKATALGILVLVFSAVSLMLSIEDAFNRIWRITVARKAAARFAMYWTVLTLGPLLLVAILASSSYVFALPLLEQADSLRTHLIGWLPFLIQWVVLTIAYTLIPNCPVRLRHAVVGALMTALTFEAAKQGFGAYVARASYQEIYGALSIVPIFIFWIYLSWIFVLLGASLTASIQAFDYQAHQPEVEPAEIERAEIERAEISPAPQRSDAETVTANQTLEEKS